MIAAGQPPQRYTTSIRSTLTFDLDVPAQTNLVTCPECGSDRDFRLWALGDDSHRAWLACPDGHEWTHPKVTYDWVRLLVDLAAAPGEQPRAVWLDYAELKRNSGSRYVTGLTGPS